MKTGKYLLSTILIAGLLAFSGCGDSSGGNDGANTTVTLTTAQKITASKALFSELRTQGYSLANEQENAYLQTEAADIEGVMNNLDFNIEISANALGAIAEAIVTADENNVSTGDITVKQEISTPVEVNQDGYTYYYNNYTQETIYTGTVTRDSTDPTKWTYSINNNMWTGAIGLPIKDLQDITETELTTFTKYEFSIDGGLPGSSPEKTAVTFTVNSSIILNRTLNADNLHETTLNMNARIFNTDLGLDLNLKDLQADVVYGTTAQGELDPKYIRVHSVDVFGKIKNYQVDGLLTVSNYAKNTNLENQGLMTTKTYNDFYIDGSCTSGDINGLVLTVDGTDYTSSAYIDSYNDGENSNLYFYISLYDVSAEAHTPSITATNCQGMQTTTQVSSYDNDIFINSGIVPQKINFNGKLSNLSTGAYLEGIVVAELSNGSSFDVKDFQDDFTDRPRVLLNITAKLQVPERPLTTLKLTFDNRTLGSNKISGSYTHGSTSVSISSSFTENMERGNITITSNGVVIAMSITDENTPPIVTVSHSGQKIADVEFPDEDVPVVKYIDGSFVSLF